MRWCLLPTTTASADKNRALHLHGMNILRLIYALNSLCEPLFLLLMSMACIIIIDFILNKIRFLSVHFARERRLYRQLQLMFRKSRAIECVVPSAIVARFFSFFHVSYLDKSNGASQ